MYAHQSVNKLVRIIEDIHMHITDEIYFHSNFDIFSLDFLFCFILTATTAATAAATTTTTAMIIIIIILLLVIM